jgi:hypothetical protein
MAPAIWAGRYGGTARLTECQSNHDRHQDGRTNELGCDTAAERGYRSRQQAPTSVGSAEVCRSEDNRASAAGSTQ